jgi:hypothetical protein
MGFVESSKKVRVDAALWERAATLQDVIAADPEMRVYIGRMSVNAICRVALLEGLKVLERRYLKGGSDGQE